MQDVPECLACGACCFSMLDSYVRVFGDDHARLAGRAEELVWFDGNRAYMRMVDGHCSALRVEGASGQLVCSAYATRPQTCRDLARGGGACRGEIEAKAPRPLLALGLCSPELARADAARIAAWGPSPHRPLPLLLHR